ncbi:MAG: radical SAM protein [Candidatus Lokiarchaeota archaeon]|nr:radical SAM protein [Candidatus Lokiarchaeota archaeon]
MPNRIIDTTISFMRKNFEKIRYNFDEIPQVSIKEPYGIYINVPFCYQLCDFCPFYKEIYSKSIVEKYLDAIINEISKSTIHGTPSWIYYGGGTPNVLTIEQLEQIVDALKSKITFENMGIEALPSLLTKEYIADLKRIGFSKLSVGVETFQSNVLESVGRTNKNYEDLRELLQYAQSLGLFTNVDMLIGLENQTIPGFLKDIKFLCEINPSQVTIYPYMAIRGLVSNSKMQNAEQFSTIEKSFSILRENGYVRRGPWTFTNHNDLYDSSRDELVEDYIGFGPAAFSGYGDYRMVNPPVGLYLHYWSPENENINPEALISKNDPESIEWRRLARMIGDLEINSQYEFSKSVKFVINVLRITGFIRNNKLTKKGLLLAHHLTKSVVENLPFPLQNPAVINNYETYSKLLSLYPMISANSSSLQSDLIAREL